MIVEQQMLLAWCMLWNQRHLSSICISTAASNIFLVSFCSNILISMLLILTILISICTVMFAIFRISYTIYHSFVTEYAIK